MSEILAVQKTINAKTLRSELGSILERVHRGERFTVLYRSRAVCRIVPIDEVEGEPTDLGGDPLYRAGAVGRSDDGRTAAEHDAVIYGEQA